MRPPTIGSFKPLRASVRSKEEIQGDAARSPSPGHFSLPLHGDGRMMWRS